MTPQEMADRAKEKQQNQKAAIEMKRNQIEQFRKSVSNLLYLVEKWLAPFMRNGTATFSRVPLPLHDKTTDSQYLIEKAEVSILDKKFSITPEYLYGFGHCCSVAITGPFKPPASLSKDDINSDDWLLTRVNRKDAVMLNEEEFMKLIESLLD